MGVYVMESVIQKEKECFVCRTTHNLHAHHIFGGISRRKHSESRGFKVWLCAYHHGEIHKHVNSGTSLYLRMLCQKYYENHYGNREDFIIEFGKSLL